MSLTNLLRTDVQDRDRKLRTILDAIPLYVAYVDTDLRFRFANRAYRALTRRPPEELIGSPVQDLIGRDFAAAEPSIRAVLAGQPTSSLEAFTSAAGERLQMRIDRVPDIDRDGHVNGYFVVCNDVTENLRAEAARLEAERRLREALVAEVHHRVKNILQGLVGLLRAQAAQRPAAAEALDPAIGQLLAASSGFGLMSTRGSAGVDICQLVSEIARNQAVVTGARVTADVDESVGQEAVLLDQAYDVNIALVLNELVCNAIKHSDQPPTARSVEVLTSRGSESIRVWISSPSRELPDDFDFDTGAGLGTGLRLARLLLPPTGCALEYESAATGVMAILSLQRDMLAAREQD